MSVKPRRRRFTVDEYYAMADAGILGPEDRVELIEGEIVEMASIGSRHAACVTRLSSLLMAEVEGRAIVRVQQPLRLSDLSEPEPDVLVARPREDFYAERHPVPADALLVVEVAHTTLGYDRDVKLPLYATAGIPEVWIVDVEGGLVDVYRGPKGGSFMVQELRGRGDVLTLVEPSGVEVRVEGIVG